MSARISRAISEEESATDRFWQTGQRRPEATSRIRSSRSSPATAGAAKTSAAAGAVRIRPIHGLADRAVLTFALPPALDALPRLLQLGVDRLRAERAGVLVGDPAVSVVVERFRGRPHAQ